MFSMFGRTGAPQKDGPPQARECWTTVRHFLACGPSRLFLPCGDI